MPPCIVRFVRVTILLLLSVLVLLGVPPSVRGVHAQMRPHGMLRAALSPAISLSAESGGVGTSGWLALVPTPPLQPLIQRVGDGQIQSGHIRSPLHYTYSICALCA